MNRRFFLAALPVAFAAGCGFQLRQLEGMPFSTLYLDTPNGSPVAQRILAALKASRSTHLVASATEAEAVLKIEKEDRTKSILSLSGAGRVIEYRLGLNLVYSISGKNKRLLAEPETIDLSRDMTYSDSDLLAKDAEEKLLYSDMDDNAALRIIRRMQALSSATSVEHPG
jgi:LPS-assembly lipoprotein